MAGKNLISLKAGLITGLCFCILISSCSPDEKVVAKVGESELTESDAYQLMHHLGYDPNNKEEFAKFVENWCENEVFKAEIKTEHPVNWNLIRLRAESFSGDLAKYYIEEIELKKKLDTIVSNDEIQAYYQSHKDEFILHDYIIKALYLKIPKSLDFKSEKIDQSYLLKNDKDLSKINSYAKLYAENFYFNDSAWAYFGEVAKDFPVKEYNIDNIVLNRTKTYFSDENYTYFLNVIDFKLKNEAPPMDFLHSEIKSIIVAHRLQDLIEKNESKLIQRLKEKHEIIIISD